MPTYRRGDKLKKLPSSFLNKTQDTNDRAASGQFSGTSPTPSNVPRDRIRIRARNDSGEDQNRFALLAVSGLVFDTVTGPSSATYEPTLTLTMPADNGNETLAVLWDPLAQGRIGDAVIMGVTPVLCDVTAEDGTSYVKPVADTSRGESTSDPTALRVLFAPPDAQSADNPTLVLLGAAGGGSTAGREARVVTVPENIAAGATVPLSAIDPAPGEGQLLVYNAFPFVIHEECGRLVVVPHTRLDGTEIYLATAPAYQPLGVSTSATIGLSGGGVTLTQGTGLAPVIKTTGSSSTTIPVLDC